MAEVNTTPATAPVIETPAAAPATPAQGSAAATATPAASPKALESGAPATPGTPKEQAAAAKELKAEIRRLKLKMDGQELDLPEEEVIKLAQQAGVSSKRFQEAAALKKQAEQVLEFIQSQPAQALKKIMDPQAYRQLLESELMEIVKRDAESPEQKKIREYEEQIRAYAEKEREAEEARKQKEEEEARTAKERAEAAKEAEYIREFDSLFSAALEKVDLVKNAYTVKRMVEFQRAAVKKGYRVDADMLAKLVKEDYDAEHKARLDRFKNEKGEFDGDRLMEFFGEDFVKALNKAQIRKLKTANAQKFATPAPEPTTDQPKEKKSWREFSKRNRKGY